jgi:hypothetical protein
MTYVYVLCGPGKEVVSVTSSIGVASAWEESKPYRYYEQFELDELTVEDITK